MKRVAILDGLRFLSILLVIVGHYLMQYNIDDNALLLFIKNNGYFGVPIFFVISGFVIIFSLENTQKYSDFLKKRYIRLAPAMLICSTLTFLFFYFLYTGDGYSASKYFPNLLISNTFIDPHVFDFILNTKKYYYIDSAYWSLWVEVCFYILIGFLYFKNKGNYVKKIVIINIIGIIIYQVLVSSTSHRYLSGYLDDYSLDRMKLLGRCLAFFHESLWFLIGIFLYQLHRDKTLIKNVFYILTCIFFLIFIEKFDLEFTFMSIFVAILFFIFIYKPSLLNFLSHPFLTKLGVSSYSVYLIHYHIGIGCIIMYNNYIGEKSYLIFFVMILFSFCFGLFSYKNLERPLSEMLKGILFKKNNIKKAAI